MDIKKYESLFELIRISFWGKGRLNSTPSAKEWERIYKEGERQSVVGLLLEGIEHLPTEQRPPQELLLQMIGEVQMIEQRNLAMNRFVADTIEDMRAKGIYTVLVKGQGLAQCYEKPLWRTSGDIDFFFSKNEFPKATEYFTKLPRATVVQDSKYTKSFGVMVNDWFVEVHGTLRSSLSAKLDREIDAMQDDIFYGRNVRSWQDGDTTVFLPDANNDLYLVFTHFVRHFYKEGVNLRQLCDWCRLMWTFKGVFNVKQLEKRLRRSGMMDEWMAFAAVAVEYLGMPKEAVPLYDVRYKKDEVMWKRKATRIIAYIMKDSARRKYRDTMEIAKIFPWNTIRFIPSIFWHLNWMKVKERLVQKRIK